MLPKGGKKKSRRYKLTNNAKYHGKWVIVASKPPLKWGRFNDYNRTPRTGDCIVYPDCLNSVKIRRNARYKENVAEYAPLFAQMGYSAEEYFGIMERGSKAGVYNLIIGL